MTDEIVNIFEKPYRPVGELSRSELENEITRWRNIWSWIEPSQQWWLTHVRSLASLTQRNYKRIKGYVGATHWELKSIDVEWIERVYDYMKRKATYETKTTTLELSSIIDYSIISEEEVVLEEPGGQPLDEALERVETIT